MATIFCDLSTDMARHTTATVRADNGVVLDHRACDPERHLDDVAAFLVGVVQRTCADLGLPAARVTVVVDTNVPRFADCIQEAIGPLLPGLVWRVPRA